MTELEALRKLEAVIKTKQTSLEGFIQEFGEIISVLKEVEAARLKDNELHLKAQKDAIDELKKEKAAMKKKMQEMAMAKVEDFTKYDKNGRPIWVGGKGGSDGDNLSLYGGSSGGSGGGASGSAGSSPDDFAFYNELKKYAKTKKFW